MPLALHVDKSMEEQKSECAVLQRLVRQKLAQRKFSTHFLTLWHLTYLLSRGSDIDANCRAPFDCLGEGGRVWQRKLGDRKFVAFDTKFDSQFAFIKEKLIKSVQLAKLVESKSMDKPFMTLHEEVETYFNEKCLVVIADYEKCLAAAATLEDDMHNDIEVVEICTKVFQYLHWRLDRFKKLSLLWNSQFLFRIHQLLLLAKDCCASNDCKEFDKLDQLEQLFVHAEFTAKLQEHFTTNSDPSQVAVRIKMFEPIFPLDALITTLKDNATCAAEQIPTALTAIIYDYSHLDPFNLGDAEAIQMKVAISIASATQLTSK